MANTYETLSELEAVNLMLATVGESPVSALDTVNDLHISMAVQFLHNSSREIQTVGYHFNQEEEYPLPLTVDGQILVPANVLTLDVSDADNSYDVVTRGTRLYDRKNHTYTFDKSLRVDIVVFLPWEELPQPAKQYIAINAARKFQRRVQGDEAVEKHSAAEEVAARAQMEDYDAMSRDYNLGDNFDVFQIISR